jgi:predicted ATP-dependent serine protease
MSINFTAATNIDIPAEFYNRIKPTNDALKELFGDGLLPGSIITLSAKHGTGKTQFCLQLLEHLATKGHRVGYISNEESREQLAFTCRRVNTVNVPIANARSVEDIVNATSCLDLLIVDSFTNLVVPGVSSPIKTEHIAIDSIIAAAKRNKCCVILITHNTKTGQSKGTSKVLHDVDATLYIEKNEEEPQLRKIYFDKNRFGAATEIYLEMTGRGIILELKSPAGDSDAPKKDKESKTTKRYKQIAEFMMDRGSVAAADVATHINVDYVKAQMLLRDMIALKQVKKTGRGQSAKYKLLVNVQIALPQYA